MFFLYMSTTKTSNQFLNFTLTITFLSTRDMEIYLQKFHFFVLTNWIVFKFICKNQIKRETMLPLTAIKKSFFFFKKIKDIHSLHRMPADYHRCKDSLWLFNGKGYLVIILFAFFGFFFNIFFSKSCQ